MDFIGAVNEVGSALRTHSDRIVSALSSPRIPCSMAEMTRSEQIWMAFAAFRLGKALEQWPPHDHPAAAVLALSPAVAALIRQDGDALHDVGLNPESLVAHGEWHRVWRSTVAYASPLQIIDGCGEMYEQCTRLERRWGWKSMLGAVAAVSSLSGAFYVAAAKAAAYLAPASALATQYASAYAVGPSAVALGLAMLAGYDKDVEEALIVGGGAQVWVSRYYWTGRLLVASAMFARSSGPSIEAHLCGAAAGLVCTYAVGYWAMPQWGRRAGLGLADLGVQAVLLGGAVGVGALMLQRR